MSKQLQLLNNDIQNKLETGEIFEIEHTYAVPNSRGRSLVMEEVEYITNNRIYLGYMEEFYIGRGADSYRLRGMLGATLEEIKNQISRTNFNKIKNSGKILRKLNGFLDFGHQRRKSRAFAQFTYKIDWKSGEFGDGGSCLWGGKIGGRAMIVKNKGFAIKLFCDKNGEIPLGRCWGYLTPVGLVIWNAYTISGKSSVIDNYGLYTRGGEYLDLIAIMLAKKLGYDSRRIILNNNGRYNGNLHINNQCGYLISTKEILDVTNDFDFKWPVIENVTRCGYCNTFSFEESDFVRSGVGAISCKPCADKFLDICSYDMRLYPKEDLLIGPDGRKYQRENMALVKKFVWSPVNNTYLIKSEARMAGINRFHDEVWIPKDDNRNVCKHCQLSLTDGDTCRWCIEIVHAADELKSGKRRVIGSTGRFEWSDSTGLFSNSFVFDGPIAIKEKPEKPMRFSAEPAKPMSKRRFNIEEIDW